nr:ribonuclease H-like domain-containing protein [Tanacetum cinerariifolium]
MASLADKAILSGADNRPLMLEKDMYDSWKSRIELYMLNRQHGKMILESVEQGPLIWPSVEVEGVTRLQKYSELSLAEAIQADYDVKATNIILQGLPPENNPHQTLKGKGIIDSGCSRHMTRNKSYLVDYQDFNSGPVAFRGSKGQIIGKGKIKTRKLDFKDVYFVKELQHFNLFFISQMCDKKNKVLFTDTECLVLSHNFKLPEENQVLLRVPRHHNMYSFNLENIVPSRGLACLIAKATVDEYTKWHISNARTLQQNRVAKRKIRTLIEAARTMLADSFLPNTFWADAVSTACYVLNMVLVTKPQNKTPYELLTGKFEEKSDEGFLVGYTPSSKAFRVYNLETKRVEENLPINFLENKPNVTRKGPTWLFDVDYLTDSMNYHPITAENKANKTTSPKETNNSVGAARASSTNYVNTTSTPVNTATTLLNTNQDEYHIPNLEDIYKVLREGIFRNASYDDEGEVADFTNLETTMNMKEVGPDGEKQAKEAKDEDVQKESFWKNHQDFHGKEQTLNKRMAAVVVMECIRRWFIGCNTILRVELHFGKMANGSL